MPYKNVYDMSDSQIINMLLQQLRSTPDLRRKELIEHCVSKLGFNTEELLDTSVSSPVVRAKSRIGMVLSGCIKSGYISESESGKMQCTGREGRVISREAARDYVIALLEHSGPMPKGKIYAQAEKDFGTDKTPDRKDDNDLRSVLGKVISRLEDEKHIVRTNNGYRLALDRRYPNTEMGSCLRRAAHGGDIEECFLDAVHIKGGEWFEVYCVELLDNYYRSSGKTVLTAAVTGGSDDGGIDGVIKTEDWLGYRETILMQMKNRRAIMSPKDIREFYGAVCAEKGSRGVFITISQFHREALKLIDRVDNLIGIDGSKLFKIACQCSHGIVYNNGLPALDEKMFLAE